MRKCSTCKQVKSLNAFYKNKSQRLGFCYECKVCMSKRRKEWRKSHKGKLLQKHDPQKSRDYHLKHKYGLMPTDFDTLELKQKSLCAICGLPKHQRHRKKLCIDHNHNTGQIRGLLCSDCNTAVGHFKVDNLGVLNLQMAIKYLGDSKNG